MGYGQLASTVLKSAGGAIAGGLGAGQSNALRAQIMAAYGNLPTAPNLIGDYNQGVQAQLGQAPQSAAQNFSLASKYGPQGAQLGANIYDTMLPQLANANLRTLGNVDPQFLQTYKNLGSSVNNELAAGTSLTPQELSQDQGYIRGAEAARGNVLGNAPVSAEALYLGNAGQQLLQTRQGAAQTYLNGANPQSQFASLAGAGTGALNASTTAATQPWQYDQEPMNYGPAYAAAGQTQFQDADTNALEKAQAFAAAPVQSNPWIAALIGGSAGASGQSVGSYTGAGAGGTAGGGFGSLFGNSAASNTAMYGGDENPYGINNEPAGGAEPDTSGGTAGFGGMSQPG